MGIIDGYKYFYYRLFRWNLKTWGKNDVPQYNALIGVTFLCYLSLFNIAIIFELITGLSLLTQFGIGKLHIVIVFLALGTLNYFLFIHHNRYLQLERYFGSESKQQRANRSLFLTFFVLASFVLFFVLIALRKSYSA
jgi:hypothetical protein